MPKHLEMLLEEPSMEAFLAEFLPRHLPNETTFRLHVHRGKNDLLRKLEDRLRGYRSWMPDYYGIVILIDRDDDDCRALKGQLESCCLAAGLATKSSPRDEAYSAVTRIAVEELEAWYFGNWPAVIRAYPKVSANVINKAALRDSDRILGGTWETLERVLQSKGYFQTGLRKVEMARNIGREIDPLETISESFTRFINALREIAKHERKIG
jgi:hypothetical protein